MMTTMHHNGGTPKIPTRWTMLRRKTCWKKTKRTRKNIVLDFCHRLSESNMERMLSWRRLEVESGNPFHPLDDTKSIQYYFQVHVMVTSFSVFVVEGIELEEKNMTIGQSLALQQKMKDREMQFETRMMSHSSKMQVMKELGSRILQDWKMLVETNYHCRQS